MSSNIPKISLIIPVYNTEKFLERALKSVEKQTFKYFETIIVNDGSTDKSYQIIEKFAQSNENVTVITQENQGLSAARNAGIQVFVWVSVFISYGYIPLSGITGSYANSIFNIWETAKYFPK